MIGVFDSGIGGLTVVKALMDLLPHHEITYLGDTARTPYGSKSADTIIKYSLNNTEFLRKKGARLIVVACNTASSYAYDAIRKRFHEPVFEVIGPGAKLALQRSRRKRIGIIGTRATIASRAYETKIQQVEPNAKVFSRPCPLLVPLVEEGWTQKPETAMIVRKYLHALKTKQIDTLILGCTHYPVLRKIIQRKIGTQVAMVDSAEAVADKVRDYLLTASADVDALPSNDDSIQKLNIFVTDTADQFRKTARLILKKDVEIQHADLPCAHP